MRLIELPAIWTILLDVFAWFVVHVGLSLVMLRMPDRFFASERRLYRSRAWEQSGLFWQKHFRVRSWKSHLPDGAAILKKGFAKKHLADNDAAYMAAFVRESRRAELTHWLAMPFALLFFLWNPPPVGWIMILYAIWVNLPCIIAQRFNRPRFQKILRTAGWSEPQQAGADDD